MEELKGPMVLMEAFAVAYQQCENICLNIAGDGSQRQKIAARAKALDVASRYRYHGVYTHPEECRAFMESLDVFRNALLYRRHSEQRGRSDGLRQTDHRVRRGRHSRYDRR